MPNRHYFQIYLEWPYAMNDLSGHKSWVAFWPQMIYGKWNLLELCSPVSFLLLLSGSTFDIKFQRKLQIIQKTISYFCGIYFWLRYILTHNCFYKCICTFESKVVFDVTGDNTMIMMNHVHIVIPYISNCLHLFYLGGCKHSEVDILA